MIETAQEIRDQFADVVYQCSTRFADYYTVGANKSVTVSARHASGKYLCHTDRVNTCEHTKRVEAYERVFGTPETRDAISFAGADELETLLPDLGL